MFSPGYKKIIRYKAADGSMKSLEQEISVSRVTGPSYLNPEYLETVLVNGQLISEHAYSLDLFDMVNLRNYRNLQFENGVMELMVSITADRER